MIFSVGRSTGGSVKDRKIQPFISPVLETTHGNSFSKSILLLKFLFPAFFARGQDLRCRETISTSQR